MGVEELEWSSVLAGRGFPWVEFFPLVKLEAQLVSPLLFIKKKSLHPSPGLNDSKLWRLVMLFLQDQTRE